jgi:hypothetical protein
MTMDWSATLVELPGARADAELAFDGVSLAAVLYDARYQFEHPLCWRMNHRGHQPERLAAMRAAWDATVPAIPEDATISLGYSARDMPQR